MLTVELEFMLEEAPLVGLDAALEGWLKEFAPTCTAKMIKPFGAGGGNHIVALSAPNPPTLLDALLVYAGGDEDLAKELLSEACEDYFF